jgi:hypothetical protein
MEAFSRQRLAQEGIQITHTVPAPVRRLPRARARTAATIQQAVNAGPNRVNTGEVQRNQRPPPPPKPRRNRRRPKGRLKRGATEEDARAGCNTPVTRPPENGPSSDVGGIRRFVLRAPQVRQADAYPRPPPRAGPSLSRRSKDDEEKGENNRNAIGIG